MDLEKITNELIYKEEVFKIIGAAMNVSNELGCGFLEAVYQEALEMEFSDLGIPFESQKKIKLQYKNRIMKKEYIVDFVCFNSIIIEIKAIRQISNIEESQIINYLKVTKTSLGIIINFGNPKLEWTRYVNTK